jgi:hypothetical protein
MAVVLTYEYPVTAGSTTPPTAAQMLGANILTVQINCSDADTTAIITHNWNLSVQEQGWIRPVIIETRTASNGTGGLTTYTIPDTTTGPANTVTWNKTSAAGSGGTFIITLLRPTTLMQ